MCENAKEQRDIVGGVAFRAQAKKYPNFGKAVGMHAEDWWANVRCFLFLPFVSF